MNNIFSALIHRRNGGVIREFVLWCILCFEMLLFLIVAVVAENKITWLILMIFTIGMGVLLVFRLTAIALLYSVGMFHLIVFTIHYVCYRPSGFVLDIFLFVLLLLLALAALICSFVHNFSRFNLDKAVMILVMTDSIFIMILEIMLYVNSNSIRGFFSRLQGAGANSDGYWLGTISFWILLALIDIYYIFFVVGLIDNRWNKIIQKPGNTGNSSGYKASAAIQGINGKYAGQVFYLNGRELVIGSDSSAGAALVIPDIHISRWHCVIRYNPGRGGNGFYEIFDRSTNGVYLNTGNRLPQNVWSPIPRGGVVGIGGMGQQFRLL